MLEAAIVLPIFLIFLLVFFDLLRVSYYNLSLVYALSRGARLSAIDFGKGTADVRAKINSELSPLGIQLDPSDPLVVCPTANFATNTNCNKAGDYRPGEARELVTYQISKPVRVYTLELFSSLTIRTITINATMNVQNEPV